MKLLKNILGLSLAFGLIVLGWFLHDKLGLPIAIMDIFLLPISIVILGICLIALRGVVQRAKDNRSVITIKSMIVCYFILPFSIIPVCIYFISISVPNLLGHTIALEDCSLHFYTVFSTAIAFIFVGLLAPIEMYFIQSTRSKIGP